METRTFRFPALGITVGGLVASVLLVPGARGQSGVDPASLPPAEVAPADPGSGQVPQVAQTPQSNYPQPYSELTGSNAANPPQTANPPSSSNPPQTPGPNQGDASQAFTGFGNAMAGAGFGAGDTGSVAMAANGAYIDTAIIRSRIRVRYDDGFGFNSPDKAEFFYGKCGCFANPSNFARFAATPGAYNLAVAAANGYDPKARGPQHFPVVTGRTIDKFGGDPSINYQEQSTYLEYASTRNFSTFVEVPVRFLNPTLVRNYYGFGDINAGFKYAMVAEPDRYYTFQMRAYMPTGAADRGLGTGHVSLEPALLVFRRLSERIYLDAEFRDWIPVGGSNFAGNVLRYGVGLSYNMVLTEHLRIAPVNEIVGWTILGGKEAIPSTDAAAGFTQVKSVAGQTIVNEKIGLRIGLGDYGAAGGGSALNDRHSLFFGYAHAMTGDHWYTDSFRMEYNLWF